MRQLLSIILILTASIPQGIGGKASMAGKSGLGGGSSPPGTWASVQEVRGRRSRATNYTCVTTVCTLTVASTGTGHGLTISAFNDNGETISSISGGCASWSIQAAASIGTGPVGELLGATCASSTSGSTSIAVTFSADASTDDDNIVFHEFSWTGSSITFDLASTVNNGTSTTPPGVDMTAITGYDVIVQIMAGSVSPASAISSPYNTTFQNNDSNAAPMAIATAYVMNTYIGTAPTWTTASEATLGSALALRGH